MWQRETVCLCRESNLRLEWLVFCRRDPSGYGVGLSKHFMVYLGKELHIIWLLLKVTLSVILTAKWYSLFLAVCVGNFNSGVYVFMILGFHRGVNEIAALLVCYVARLAVSYRRFGTTCRFYLQGSKALSSRSKAWPLKMELLGCPETSVNYCQSKLLNIPEERRYP
jgi:hypothetical protein